MKMSTETKVVIGISIAAILVGLFAMRGLSQMSYYVPDTPPLPTLKDESRTGYAELRPGVVTGSRVTYVVPEGTTKITAKIQEDNGRLIQDFVITRYFTIKPGQRLQIVAE